jgi:predicted nucleic acid-binding protein
MEEKEVLLKEIKSLIADSQKDSITKEVLEARIEAINKQIAEKLDNAEIKALKEGVDKLVAATAENAAAIKAMTEKTTKEFKESPVSFKDALIAAVMGKKEVAGLLSEKNDDYGKRFSLKDYFTEKGNRTSPTFVINKAVDMLESNIVQANVANIRLTELDPQRVGIPLTIYPHVVDWVPSKTILKPHMSLLVVYTYTDGAATKTEGSASGQSSFLLKTVEFKSFFIATYFTLSDETLDDLNEAMEEIAVTAPSKILDKIDGYVLGTAGDDSTAIAGLLTANKKTDFASSTTYAGKIAGANEVDAIATMKLQCETNKYRPDVVLMAPFDVSKLGAKKDQLDNSITDRRVVYSVTGEPTMVAGMRIISSTAIEANTVVVLDSKQLMIGKRKDMTMEIGYNGTDLTEGQKTVVIKIRLAFGVRDKAAVIYCADLDQAVTDITVA